jgi:hypothetical protein
VSQYTGYVAGFLSQPEIDLKVPAPTAQFRTNINTQIMHGHIQLDLKKTSDNMIWDLFGYVSLVKPAEVVDLKNQARM